ncbi:MAG: hypothetical protein DSM106950_34155 [Stigonema ocellatum SAG 48.90 = DSM 106950]|nr:hypothetical protein [Stigonema ocellatum SAG 48.90 = DSM 106950]
MPQEKRSLSFKLKAVFTPQRKYRRINPKGVQDNKSELIRRLIAECWLKLVK